MCPMTDHLVFETTNQIFATYTKATHVITEYRIYICITMINVEEYIRQEVLSIVVNFIATTFHRGNRSRPHWTSIPRRSFLIWTAKSTKALGRSSPFVTFWCLWSYISYSLVGSWSNEIYRGWITFRSRAHQAELFKTGISGYSAIGLGIKGGSGGLRLHSDPSCEREVSEWFNSRRRINTTTCTCEKWV